MTESKQSRLLAIATHQKHLGEIALHQNAQVSTENGLGDYRGKKNTKTAITLLSKQSWETACLEAGASLDWTQRRAQLLIDDITFSEADLGRHIAIGEVILRITQETDPCKLMDKLHLGLKNALTPDWRGGARCEVIQGGIIQVNDVVQWLD